MRNVQEPGAYEDRSSLEAIAITNTLMATVEKMGGGLPQSLSFAALDKRVPELHNEFGREGRWPPQCDPGLGMRLLQNAYEHARSIGVSRLRLQQEHVTVRQALASDGMHACISFVALPWNLPRFDLYTGRLYYATQTPKPNSKPYANNCFKHKPVKFCHMGRGPFNG